MDWDKVRIFLEVARTGQILGAAKRLKLNHATVARQLTALEKDLKTKLLNRQTTGSSLTPSGVALLAAAERAESELLKVGSQLTSAADKVAGTVRIGAPDGLGNYFLADRLGGFAAANPDLIVQLVALPRTFSLAKREADIVVTLERPDEGQADLHQAHRLHAERLRVGGLSGPVDADPRARRSRRPPADHLHLRYHLQPRAGLCIDLQRTDHPPLRMRQRGRPA
jgi:DNA-binding transcriptional LysR family regulator